MQVRFARAEQILQDAVPQLGTFAVAALTFSSARPPAWVLEIVRKLRQVRRTAGNPPVWIIIATMLPLTIESDKAALEEPGCDLELRPDADQLLHKIESALALLKRQARRGAVVDFWRGADPIITYSGRALTFRFRRHLRKLLFTVTVEHLCNTADLAAAANIPSGYVRVYVDRVNKRFQSAFRTRQKLIEGGKRGDGFRLRGRSAQ